MEDNIRIYYNEQCVFIAQNAQKLIAEYNLKNAWVIRDQNLLSFKQHFLLFTQSSFDILVVEGLIQSLFPSIIDEFKFLQAGGGIVRNDEGALLMIERLGKWDLPKGKLDDGEDIESCSLREVREETGLREVFLKRFVKSTYHIYNMKNQWILKQTKWFEMKAITQDLIPQAEEDITQSVWVAPDLVQEKLESSYPNIVHLLKENA